MAAGGESRTEVMVTGDKARQGKAACGKREDGRTQRRLAAR